MTVADCFAANLRKVIDSHDWSVNRAAAEWKVPVKTLEYVLKGMRIPTLDTAERLSKAAGYDMWQMLFAAFDPANPPVLKAITPQEEALYQRLRDLARDLPTGE